MDTEKEKIDCLKRICLEIDNGFLGKWYKFIVLILRKMDHYEMTQLYYQKQKDGPYYLATLDDFDYIETGWTEDDFYDGPFDTYQLRQGHWNQFYVEIKNNQTFEYKYDYILELEDETFNEYLMKFERQHFGKLANYMRIQYDEDNIYLSIPQMTALPGTQEHYEQWMQFYNLEERNQSIQETIQSIANTFNHMLDDWHKIVLGIFYEAEDYQIKVFYQTSSLDQYQEFTDKKSLARQLTEDVEHLYLNYVLVKQPFTSMTYMLEDTGYLDIQLKNEPIKDISQYIKNWQNKYI